MVLVGVIALALIGSIWVTASSLMDGAGTFSAQPEPDRRPRGPGRKPPPPPTEEDIESQPPPGKPADVGDLAEQVARLHDLPLRRRVRTRVTTAEALADKVSQIAFEENDAKEVEDTERLLVALRLAPPGTDLDATMERLYREQILGLYIPKERTLYVRKGGDKSPLQRVTTVHEITHALQDQSFDLEAMQRRVRKDSEASLALLSLIEGDAVLTQQVWVEQYLDASEMQRLADEGQGSDDALDDAPDYLQASLFFPYREGAQFVVDLFRTGGFAAINEAFADPPTTTEQILHPERYRAGDEADDVTVTARPPGDWDEAATFPFGEFDLLEIFAGLGSDSAETAAEGWGGGEIRSWEQGEDTAVAAALTFDSIGDATEACDAFGRWYVQVVGGRGVGEGLYASSEDHLALRCGGAAVRFGLGPSPAMARQLAQE